MATQNNDSAQRGSFVIPRAAITPGHLFLIVVFPLLLGIFYFIFRTETFSFDGHHYLVAAQTTGDKYYHPHHLLFSPAVRGVFIFLNSVMGFSVSVAVAGQIHNIFFAVLGVWMVYFLCRRNHASEKLAFGAAMFLALSFFYWRDATETEVYVPSATCLLILSYFLMAPVRTRAMWCAMALSWAVAVLYHQMAVLFIIPLVYLLLLEKHWKPFLFLCVGAGLPVLAAYLYTTWVTYGVISPETLKKFTFFYSTLKGSGWGTFNFFSAQGFDILAVSIGKIFLGYHYNDFYAREFLAIIVLLAITGVLFSKAPFRFFLCVWVMTHFLFMQWWIPMDAEMYLMSIPCLVILAFLGAITITEKIQQPRIFDGFCLLAGVFLLANNIRDIQALQRPIAPLISSRSELITLAQRDASTVIGFPSGPSWQLSIFDTARKRSYLAVDVMYQQVTWMYRRADEGYQVDGNYSLMRDRPLLIPYSALCPQVLVSGASDVTGTADEYIKFVDWLSRNNSGAYRSPEVIHGKFDTYLYFNDLRSGEPDIKKLSEEILASPSCQQAHNMPDNPYYYLP